MNKFKEVWFLNPEKQFKDWNTSNNVDVNQLHLLLQFINVHDSTDYQLGFITQQNEKLPNGKSIYAITIFPNRTSGLVHGPVVWILNDNHEYLTGQQARYQTLSHWEGLSHEPIEYGRNQVNSWGLDAAAQSLINQGLFQVDKNRPSGSPILHSIPGGYFVSTPQEGFWNAYIEAVQAKSKEPTSIVCSLDGTGLDVVPNRLLYPIGIPAKAALPVKTGDAYPTIPLIVETVPPALQPTTEALHLSIDVLTTQDPLSTNVVEPSSVANLIQKTQEVRDQIESPFLPLCETFKNKRIFELRRYLTDYSLDSTGKKATLVARCEEHYKIQYESYCQELKESR
jgi:hypothetical protein